jgi:hypothetical protein
MGVIGKTTIHRRERKIYPVSPVSMLYLRIWIVYLWIQMSYPRTKIKIEHKNPIPPEIPEIPELNQIILWKDRMNALIMAVVVISTIRV